MIGIAEEYETSPSQATFWNMVHLRGTMHPQDWRDQGRTLLDQRCGEDVWGTAHTAVLAAMYLEMTRMRPAAARALIVKGRRQLRDVWGIDPNPLGVDNSKVGGPSTYKSLPGSCPRTCPYLGDCYASGGHVVLAARRARDLLWASLGAIILGIVVAQRDVKSLRLHVSGDFGRPEDGGIDPLYLQGLELLGLMLKHDKTGRRKVGRKGGQWAWTYTHYSHAEMGAWTSRLRTAGVEVNFSDHMGAGGALIWDFDGLESLAAMMPPGVTLHKCPNQTDGISCHACGLCSSLYRNRRAVVFDPHGGRRSVVLSSSQAALERSLTLRRLNKSKRK